MQVFASAWKQGPARQGWFCLIFSSIFPIFILIDGCLPFPLIDPFSLRSGRSPVNGRDLGLWSVLDKDSFGTLRGFDWDWCKDFELGRVFESDGRGSTKDVVSEGTLGSITWSDSLSNLGSWSLVKGTLIDASFSVPPAVCPPNPCFSFWRLHILFVFFLSTQSLFNFLAVTAWINLAVYDHRGWESPRSAGRCWKLGCPFLLRCFVDVSAMAVIVQLRELKII